MNSSIKKLILFSLPVLGVYGGYLFALLAGGVSVGVSPYRLLVLISIFWILLSRSFVAPSKGVTKIFFYMILFWCAWGMISLAWTPNLSLGVKQVLSLTFSLIVFFVIFSLCKDNQKMIDTFLRGWRLSFLIACAVGIWEVLTGDHLPSSYMDDLPWYADKTKVAYSFFGNPNNYSAYIAISLPFMLQGAIEKVSRQIPVLGLMVRILYFIAIAISIFFVIMNGSKAGFLALIAEIVIFSIFMLRKKQYKFSAIIVVVLFASVLFIFSQNDYQASGTSMSEDLSKLFQDDQDDQSISTKSRLVLFEIGLDNFLSSGGFGIGAGGFGTESMNQSGLKISPHNFLLSIFSQYGLLVFLLFLYWLLSITKKALSVLRMEHQNRSPHTQAEVILTSVVGFLAASISNSSWLTSSYVWLYMSMITIVIAYADPTISTKRRRRN